MQKTQSNFYVVIPHVRAWGGEKTMRPEGMPEDLFRETMKLVPMKAKSPFENFRKAARRVLEKRGLRFAGGAGIVIPAEVLQEAEADLEDIKTKFFAELNDTFMPTVRSKIESQAEKFPEWKARILQHAPDLEKIRSAFEFKWWVTEIGGEHQSIVNEIGQFERQLYRETAEAAREMLVRMRERNGSCNRKTVEAIRGIARKIEGLKFIDPKILPLAKGIMAALDAHLPKEGPLTDEDRIVVRSLLLTMASPESMSLAAETVVGGGDFWVKPTPAPQPQVAATSTEVVTANSDNSSKAPIELVVAQNVVIAKRQKCFF
jgi:hypothetical protein